CRRSRRCSRSTTRRRRSPRSRRACASRRGCRRRRPARSRTAARARAASPCARARRAAALPRSRARRTGAPPLARGRRRPDESDDAERLDLDHHPRKSERSDLHRRRRRRRARHQLRSQPPVLAQGADVGQVDAELHDRLERRAGLLEHRGEIRERLPHLRLEVALPDERALGRERALAGDEDHGLRAVDPPCLREAEPVLPAPRVALALLHPRPPSGESGGPTISDSYSAATRRSFSTSGGPGGGSPGPSGARPASRKNRSPPPGVSSVSTCAAESPSTTNVCGTSRGAKTNEPASATSSSSPTRNLIRPSST